MNKLIAITTIIATIASGCSDNVERVKSEPGQKIRVERLGSDHTACYEKVTLEGHDYIVLSNTYGVGIVHSGSCPCRSK